jgi:hypothetical protein
VCGSTASARLTAKGKTLRRDCIAAIGEKNAAVSKSSSRRCRVPGDRSRSVSKFYGRVPRRLRGEKATERDAIAHRSSREPRNPPSPRLASPRPSLASVSCHPLGHTRSIM